MTQRGKDTMTDNDKTKAGLLDEINTLRARIKELEGVSAGKDVYHEALEIHT